jgi:hypothetical protein
MIRPMATTFEDDLLTFWKDCYRDAQRELVRAHGLEGLMLAPRIAQIASSLANESTKQYARRVFPKCPKCAGDGAGMPTLAGMPTVCEACRGLGAELPAENGRLASVGSV